MVILKTQQKFIKHAWSQRYIISPLSIPSNVPTSFCLLLPCWLWTRSGRWRRSDERTKSLAGDRLSSWFTCYSYTIASQSYLLWLSFNSHPHHLRTSWILPLRHHILGTGSKFYLLQLIAIVWDNCKLPVDDDHSLSKHSPFMFSLEFCHFWYVRGKKRK